jgi:hypothetical protein
MNHCGLVGRGSTVLSMCEWWLDFLHRDLNNVRWTPVEVRVLHLEDDQDVRADGDRCIHVSQCGGEAPMVPLV